MQQELRPHAAFSIQCPFRSADPNAIADGELLALQIGYRPKFFPWMTRTGGETFLMRRDRNGNAVWLPLGIEDATKLNRDIRTWKLNPGY